MVGAGPFVLHAQPLLQHFLACQVEGRPLATGLKPLKLVGIKLRMRHLGTVQKGWRVLNHVPRPVPNHVTRPVLNHVTRPVLKAM